MIRGRIKVMTELSPDKDAAMETGKRNPFRLPSGPAERFQGFFGPSNAQSWLTLMVPFPRAPLILPDRTFFGGCQGYGYGKSPDVVPVSLRSATHRLLSQAPTAAPATCSPTSVRAGTPPRTSAGSGDQDHGPPLHAERIGGETVDHTLDEFEMFEFSFYWFDHSS